MGNNRKEPFQNLGSALKQVREAQAKTHAEVSGAVEISVDHLVAFETGEKRPTEDILFLLIQHFSLDASRAAELWRLAGYDSFEEALYASNDDEAHKSRTFSVSAQDARIVYTDMIQVMVNNYGVIINFLQGAGVNDKPLAVSRIGMSKEHARSVVELLTKTLEQSESMESSSSTPRQLPSESSRQD